MPSTVSNRLVRVSRLVARVDVLSVRGTETARLTGRVTLVAVANVRETTNAALAIFVWIFLVFLRPILERVCLART